MKFGYKQRVTHRDGAVSTHLSRPLKTNNKVNINHLRELTTYPVGPQRKESGIAHMRASLQ